MTKIGITFDPPEEPIKMFSNGIRQNAFYLMELLINCHQLRRWRSGPAGPCPA